MFQRKKEMMSRCDKAISDSMLQPVKREISERFQGTYHCHMPFRQDECTKFEVNRANKNAS